MNKQPNKAIGENERRPDVSVRFVDHKLTARHMKTAKRRAKGRKATSGHKVVSLMRIRRLYKDASPYLSSLVAKQLLVGRAPEGAIKPEDVRNEDFEGAGYFFDPSQYAMHMRDYGPLPKDKDAMAKWLGNN